MLAFSDSIDIFCLLASLFISGQKSVFNDYFEIWLVLFDRQTLVFSLSANPNKLVLCFYHSVASIVNASIQKLMRKC